MLEYCHMYAFYLRLWMPLPISAGMVSAKGSTNTVRSKKHRTFGAIKEPRSVFWWWKKWIVKRECRSSATVIFSHGNFQFVLGNFVGFCAKTSDFNTSIYNGYGDQVFYPHSNNNKKSLIARILTLMSTYSLMTVFFLMKWITAHFPLALLPGEIWILCFKMAPHFFQCQLYTRSIRQCFSGFPGRLLLRARGEYPLETFSGWTNWLPADYAHMSHSFFFNF